MSATLNSRLCSQPCVASGCRPEWLALMSVGAPRTHAGSGTALGRAGRWRRRQRALRSDFKAVRLAPRIAASIGGIKADHGCGQLLSVHGEAQVVKVNRGVDRG